MENTELLSKTENLLLFLRKSNYSWSENTINQNIRRIFLYSYVFFAVLVKSA